MKITLYSTVPNLPNLTLKCAAVRQHLWSDCYIVDPSKSSRRKLERFIAAHRTGGFNLPRTSFGRWGTQYRGTILREQN